MLGDLRVFIRKNGAQEGVLVMRGERPSTRKQGKMKELRKVRNSASQQEETKRVEPRWGDNDSDDEDASVTREGFEACVFYGRIRPETAVFDG